VGLSVWCFPLLHEVSQDQFDSGEKPGGKVGGTCLRDLRLYRPLWYSLEWTEAR
jgi:hypothetical protein